MELILILVGAVLLDLLVGEYPTSLHPTVWAGRLIDALIKPGFQLKPIGQLVYGALVSLLTITIFSLVVFWLMTWCKDTNRWLFVLVGILIFKSTFCIREQWKVAGRTKEIIQNGQPVPQNMRGLFDTVKGNGSISNKDIISSSVRSIAENASDFVVAPFFYFLIFGVPGAVAYRVINTLDNMIGYRGKFEYLGKFAARLDDLVNFVPARLTGLAIVLGAKFRNLDFRKSWTTMLTQHSLTPGPNGGWPMTAAAGALGVTLAKHGHYSIGIDPPIDPDFSAIDGAIGLFIWSVSLWIIASICVLTAVLFIRG